MSAATSSLLVVLTELVGDVIVNGDPREPLAVSRPVPGRVLRYHGHAPPEDLDCEGGSYLAAWWENMVPKSTTLPCPGPPVVTLGIKYVQCWKIAESVGGALTLHDGVWDTDAGTLADLAEDVMRVLTMLSCADGNPTGYEFVDAVVPLISKPRYVSTIAAGAGSGAAGVVWRINAGLRALVPSSS
jgi:hypothetical protein